jgi:hypothetical protein
MKRTPTLADVGKALRKGRLAKKWRPRDVQRRTKIQLEYVRKMEAGEFDFFPEAIIRGFIRAYAQEVGLDPHEILALYDQAKAAGAEEIPEGGKPVRKEETDSESARAEIARKEASRKRAASQKGSAEPEVLSSVPSKADVPADSRKGSFLSRYRGEIVLSALLAAILFSLGYVYVRYGRGYFSRTQEEVKPITVFEARKEQLEKEQKKPVLRARVEPELPVREVKARIVAVESTWVRVIRDGKDTTEYIFAPGIRRNFTARNRIEMRLGRADGLIFWVNEDSVGKLGTPDQVVSRLVIGPEGILERRLVRPKPKTAITRPALPDTL